jgi:hypothetical protein
MQLSSRRESEISRIGGSHSQLNRNVRAGNNN